MDICKGLNTFIWWRKLFTLTKSFPKAPPEHLWKCWVHIWETLLYLYCLLPGQLLRFVDSLLIGLFVFSRFIQSSSPSRLQFHGHSSHKTGMQLKKASCTTHTHIPAALHFLTWLVQLIMYQQPFSCFSECVYFISRSLWLFFIQPDHIPGLKPQESRLERTLRGKNYTIEGWFSSIILSLSWIKYFVLAGAHYALHIWDKNYCWLYESLI